MSGISGAYGVSGPQNVPGQTPLEQLQKDLEAVRLKIESEGPSLTNSQLLDLARKVGSIKNQIEDPSFPAEPQQKAQTLALADEVGGRIVLLAADNTNHELGRIHADILAVIPDKETRSPLELEQLWIGGLQEVMRLQAEISGAVRIPTPPIVQANFQGALDSARMTIERLRH